MTEQMMEQMSEPLIEKTAEQMNEINLIQHRSTNNNG